MIEIILEEALTEVFGKPVEVAEGISVYGLKERPRIDCSNCQHWSQRSPASPVDKAWGICYYADDNLIRHEGALFTRESFFCQGFQERQNTVASPPLQSENR